MGKNTPPHPVAKQKGTLRRDTRKDDHEDSGTRRGSRYSDAADDPDQESH
jgi:hypothetical protein